MATTPPPYDWLTGDGDTNLLARGTTPEQVHANIRAAFANGNDGTEPWPLLDIDADHWRIDDHQDLTPTWHRKNPCSESNCWEPDAPHGWHLGTGHEGQPGAFLAATVTIVADPPAEDPDPVVQLPEPLFPDAGVVDEIRADAALTARP